MKTKIPYLTLDKVSVNTDYASDYLINLCKKSTLDCRNISHVWFIKEKSINQYLKKQGRHYGVDFNKGDYIYIAEAIDGSAKIYLDNTEFISVDKAEEISGYTRDYITQLAREGAVEAHKFSKSWFIQKESLLNHKTGSLSEIKNRKQKNTRFMYSTETLNEDIPSITKKRDVVGVIDNSVKDEHKLKIHKVYNTFIKGYDSNNNDTKEINDELPNPLIENNEHDIDKNILCSDDNLKKEKNEVPDIINIEVDNTDSNTKKLKHKKTTKKQKNNFMRIIIYINLLLSIILLFYLFSVKYNIFNAYTTVIFN